MISTVLFEAILLIIAVLAIIYFWGSTISLKEQLRLTVTLNKAQLKPLQDFHDFAVKDKVREMTERIFTEPSNELSANLQMYMNKLSASVLNVDMLTSQQKPILEAISSLKTAVTRELKYLNKELDLYKDYRNGNAVKLGIAFSEFCNRDAMVNGRREFCRGQMHNFRDRYFCDKCGFSSEVNKEPADDFVEIKIGTDYGENCNRSVCIDNEIVVCAGTIIDNREGGCSCPTGHPPCSHCTTDGRECDKCGWIPT